MSESSWADQRVAELKPEDLDSLALSEPISRREALTLVTSLGGAVTKMHLSLNLMLSGQHADAVKALVAATEQLDAFKVKAVNAVLGERTDGD